MVSRYKVIEEGCELFPRNRCADAQGLELFGRPNGQSDQTWPIQRAWFNLGKGFKGDLDKKMLHDNMLQGSQRSLVPRIDFYRF